MKRLAGMLQGSLFEASWNSWRIGSFVEEKAFVYRAVVEFA
jgi:hypothetical protein